MTDNEIWLLITCCSLVVTGLAGIIVYRRERKR